MLKTRATVHKRGTARWGYIVKTWIRKGYKIKERDFDYDLHEFVIIRDDNTIAGTITPDCLESMKEIISQLDNGDDFDGCEDGMGNTIRITLEEE